MLNWQIIHGYLGRDPELTTFTKDGKEGYVVNFSVAVGRNFEEKTDWFRCEMFGERAKVIDKFFQKGSQIALVGRNISEKYTDKNGVERLSWKIRVLDFDFCDSKNSPRGSNNQAAQDDIPDSWEQFDGDNPFN